MEDVVENNDLQGSEMTGDIGNAFPISADQIGSRIGTVSDLIGDRKTAAEAAGVSVASLQRYIAGSMPPFDAVIGLAMKSGVSLQWLATGKGEMRPSAQSGERYDNCHGVPHPDEYAYIPLYNVEASAGHGSYVETEEVASRLAFRLDWINKELHANPSHLHMIYVRGDSMETSLESGEVVMVDTSAALEPIRDGIHVIQIDGSVLIKRLQRLPGNRIKVTSDNAVYGSFEADLNNAEIRIVGRVIWHAGRI